MNTPTFSEAVTRRVAEAIARSGRTQLSISQETGIARTTLIRRLAGHTPFTVVELDRLARALGMNAEDFLQKEEAA